MVLLIILFIHLLNSCSITGASKGAVENWVPGEEGYQLFYHIGELDSDIVTEIPKYDAPSLSIIHSTCRFYRQWNDPGAVVSDRYDFITEILTEDNLLLDTLITRSCSDSDMRVGIFPGEYRRDKPNTEYMVYMTEDGVCHKRTYKIEELELTAMITRSEMEDGVDCPDEMKNRLAAHPHTTDHEDASKGNYRGFVLGWSPAGKYLHTNFTKGFIKETTLDIEHSFVGEVAHGVKYTLICKETTVRVKGSDKTATVLTGTIVVTPRLTLDRFELDSCTADSIKSSFLPSFQDGSYSLVFKDNNNMCLRREYTISPPLDKKYYQRYNIKRTVPRETECPEALKTK